MLAEIYCSISVFLPVLKTLLPFLVLSSVIKGEFFCVLLLIRIYDQHNKQQQKQILSVCNICGDRNIQPGDKTEGKRQLTGS